MSRAQATAVRITHAANEAHIGKVFTGRPKWTLSGLVGNGEKGIRTIDCPATQLPFYIYQLRQELGYDLIPKTIERHGGPFAGTHARYFLADETMRLEYFTPDKIPKRKKTAGDEPARSSNPKNSNDEIGGLSDD